MSGRYRDAFIICKVVSDDEGSLRLDVNFPVYHMTVTYLGICSYCYLNNSMKDQEVMAYIHYMDVDEEKVKKFEGYLGNDWKVVRDDPKILPNWSMKKEDALATTDALDVKVTYKGADKLKIVHPYQAKEDLLLPRFV
jgi:hypothetical protein